LVCEMTAAVRKYTYLIATHARLEV
jgi:hypothetical protein